MKRTHDYVILVAVSFCTITTPLSTRAQSVGLVTVTAGSSNSSNIIRPYGDVQNIGNRNVSGKIFGILPNLVSMEDESALGQQMAKEFEQTAKLLKDPVITEYIDRLGQNLARHSDAKVPFQIKVVDADAANILALPAGFLYVNKGLILEAESESELAGSMSHGIAHVCARHATQLQSKKQYLQLSDSTASGGESPSIHYSYSSGGLSLELVGITREFEAEADQLGIQYLWNTGYDPNAFVSFLEKIRLKEKSNPGRSAAFFRAYPSTADRIAQCLKEQQALPIKDLYLTSSPEFDRVKARLLAEK
jgi:beta-barrel assembly-enhancing protease